MNLEKEDEQPSNSKNIDRRTFVKTTAALAGVSVAGEFMEARTVPPTEAKRDNRVAAENSKPGTIDWQLRYTKLDDPATLASYPLNRRLRSSAIEGFCSRSSVLPGESLDIMVSLAPAGKFTIDIYRMGFYGGAGARHMQNLGAFSGKPQSVPMMGMERLRECQWETCASLSIPRDWPSGVYLGKLSRMEDFGAQSYIVFVVKERRRADLLVAVSDLTWNAYNKWPGNNSMYDDGTPEVWYTGPNVRVSLDRPHAKYCQHVDAPGTIGSGGFLLWEYPFTYWAEQQGYDVIYCSNVDLHTDPDILKLAKAYVSVGHDEYWSGKMLDEAVKARDEGLSFAFFSGNTIWCELEVYRSSVTGRDFRAYARKEDFNGRETRLMGSRSRAVGYGDWVVTKPDHWVYQGTGVREGDRVYGLIGWEYNSDPPADIPGLEIVASSRLYPHWQKKLIHHGVVFPGGHGNWVFNAGTIWWPQALSAPVGHIPARNVEFGTFGPDARIQRVTANVLDRMIRDSNR